MPQELDRCRGFMIIGSESPYFGGAETLSLRMFQWCVSKGIRSFWFGAENPYEPRMKNALEKIPLDEVRWSPCKFGRSIVDGAKNVPFLFSDIKELTVIVYRSSSFVAAEVLKRRYPKIRFNIFFYSVTTFDLCTVNKPFSEFIGSRLSAIPDNVLTKMVKQKMIVFVSRDAAQVQIQKRKDLTLDEVQTDVIKLPYELKPFDKNDVFLRWHAPEKVIATFTRFDFPTKAYVLGLIDAFADLVEQGIEGIKLLIAGGGAGKEQLLEKINAQPVKVREKISIQDPLPYNEMKDLMGRAYVNVGLGTTVLDACSCGVPSIVTNVYSQDCLTKAGYFFTYPDEVAPYGEGEQVLKYLLDVLSASFNRYLELSEACYEACRKYYSIDAVMPSWIQRENASNTAVMSKHEVNVYQMKMRLFRALQYFFHIFRNRSVSKG